MHVIAICALGFVHTRDRFLGCVVCGGDIRVTFEITSKCGGCYCCNAQSGCCRDQFLDQVKISEKLSVDYGLDRVTTTYVDVSLKTCLRRIVELWKLPVCPLSGGHESDGCAD
jgi:hypothetical protein